ncbi:unnamed protein product [Rhizophagus irregularis]|nr:unnamed protein product [Rhizophagus irregularis]
MVRKSKKTFVNDTDDTDKPSKKQRKSVLGTFKSRSRQFVACDCNKCKGRKVDPRTRESHMRERELPIRSESSNMATEGGISQINAPYDPMELDEININDVDSDTDFNNKQVFSFLVKNPRNPKQKQLSSHVSFPLVVTEQLLYNSEEEQATNEDEDVYFNEEDDDDDDLLGQHVNFDTPEYDDGIEGAELPIPDINAGFTWIVYWIFKYQERYRLPDTAIDSLLKFVRYILVLVDENTYSKFPKTLYMARKLFGIGNQLIKFATCKKCCKLYAVKDLPTDQPYHCTFQDYPNHPMSNLRSYCNNIITKQIPTNQGMMFKPSLIFPIISIKRRLQQLYNTKGFEESCRKWTNRPNNEKELADIFDGRIWKTFEDPNNSQLFF